MPRTAPPALVAAIAGGLGSVDMPVPSVVEWEWLNWRFPRPVHAGDTIYARWTLTQKRPPRDGAASSIVVWRVDVHTADGALCAEGEVGAKVKRDVSAKPQRVEGEQPEKRRRRRRSRGGNGAAATEPPPVAAPPAAASKPERTSGPARRRRRRRSSGSAAREEEHEPRAAHVPETTPGPVAASPVADKTPSPTGRRGIGGVLRRLRGST
jgi:hypothetical protein